MKKLIQMGLCVAVAAVMASGCQKSDTTETQTTAAAEEETAAEADLTDEASITIGNYKGLVMTAKQEAVTDEQVEEGLQYLLIQFPAEVTGRAAKEGDVANIDYVGTKDGVAFSGGTAEGYDLELGSDTFIDGFEDGVIGMLPGEEKDLNLTFPESYGNADLAGQAVVFHVTLNSIKSAEETVLDDAFAQRVLEDETATVETLRDMVRENLEIQADSNFFNSAGSELLAQAVENAQITCDPDAVEQMYDGLQTTYNTYAAQYGMELEEFLSLFVGTDLDGLKESAENLVKQEMALDEILKAENLTATDEQKERLARMNYFESAEEMISTYGEESAERLFSMGAAYFYLIDNAVEAEPETAETEAE